MPNNADEIRKMQEEYRNAQLERAGAYEEMVRTKGFEHLKSYYRALLTQFTNDQITNAERPTQEFDTQRRELIGINKMLAHVQGDLSALEAYRKEQRGEQPDKQA